MDLSGRAILVTGASSGIGRETSILLSQLGARVILAGRSQERLEQTHQAMAGADHLVEVFDLLALAQIPEWIKRLAASMGPLHGLVHCAGVHNAHPLKTLSADKFEEVMRANVSSALMLAKGFRQKGCHAAGAAIVLLSSTAGLVGEPGVAAYAASKAALLGLSRSLAAELASQGIRVNCVAPGMVRTEMSGRLRQLLLPEQFAALEARHLLGLGEPRDVANAIAFLLADTGRWITGSTLVIDGGYTCR